MSKIAVIKTGGKQYKVAEKDVIYVEKLEGAEGKNIKLETLLTADGAKVEIGTPAVKSSVEGKIVKQFRDKKFDVIKFKSKIRYRRKYGHRQDLTKLEIVSI